MSGLHALGLVLIAAAAAPAAGQDAGQETPAPSSAPAPSVEPPPAPPVVQDVAIEIGGVRARVVLRRGTALEGLLPLGPGYWEKSSPGMDYEEADASDPAAGLRLYFVLGMEGAIFFRKGDIAEVKDLGAISDEAAAEIRQNLLDARRKALEEKETRLKESLAKILGNDAAAAPLPAAPAPVPAELPVPAPGVADPAPAAGTPPAVPAPGPSSLLTKEDQAKAKAEARRIRGEELLAKYPPPDWSQKRLETIQWRVEVAKVPADELEAVFLKEFDVWLEALRRREAAEKSRGGTPGSGDAPADAGSPAPR